jgi:hypothetical protein
MTIDDSFTKSLLHFDGADAGTVFTDESGKSWTGVAHAQIDTAQSYFGGASGYFDGVDDYIETADNEDFDVGSGDFTIDSWIRPFQSGTVICIFGQMNSTQTAGSTSYRGYISATNKLITTIQSGTTSYSGTSTASIGSAAWAHVAMVRNGNTIYNYINGTNDGTISVTGLTVNNSGNKVSVGRQGEYNGFYFKGWIDEFRFSKGTARWTANFTPPVIAYAPVGGNQVVWFS